MKTQGRPRAHRARFEGDDRGGTTGALAGGYGVLAITYLARYAILVVLAIESAFELSVFDKGILRLSPNQVLLAAPLSFAVFFIGTVLPTMVLIYAILLPRYLKLTGSAISTVLLGGLTYAAMHIVEGWSAFDSPRDTGLSLIFVLLTYFGPGMIKSVLTLRTGNAWVHALGYHAVAPHVVADAPLVVKIFGIR